jgi:ABC-2 type transport system permease protein
MVFLQKITGEELLIGLAIEAAWAVGFVVLARWLYRLGLRHYSAYGG